jgi:hypothetical protein
MLEYLSPCQSKAEEKSMVGWRNSFRLKGMSGTPMNE